MRFSESRITRVIVRGFRSLADVKVDLDPTVTVLVGPNSSGKSSFVDALMFLQQAILDSPQQAFQRRGGIARVVTATARHPATISIEVHIRSRMPDAFEGSYFIQFRTEQEGQDKFWLMNESCEISWSSEPAPHSFSVKRELKDGRPGELEWDSIKEIRPRLAENRLALALMSGLKWFEPVYQALTLFSSYAITSNALRSLQESDSGNRLAVDGSNAASVLKRLSEVDKSCYDRVVETMSRIVPSIEKIAPIKEGRSVTLFFDESFGGKKRKLPASSMSDGTLQMLGVLLAAYQEEALTLIGLEEPEAAVHPGVMAVLAEALQEAGQRVQVLITTHSPDLITRFNIEALRAVDRNTLGMTQIAPIAGSQQEAIRRRLFTAGELHRIEGLRPSSATGEESNKDAHANSNR